MCASVCVCMHMHVCACMCVCEGMRARMCVCNGDFVTMVVGVSQSACGKNMKNTLQSFTFAVVLLDYPLVMISKEVELFCLLMPILYFTVLL